MNNFLKAFVNYNASQNKLHQQNFCKIIKCFIHESDAFETCLRLKIVFRYSSFNGSSYNDDTFT